MLGDLIIFNKIFIIIHFFVTVNFEKLNNEIKENKKTCFLPTVKLDDLTKGEIYIITKVSRPTSTFGPGVVVELNQMSTLWLPKASAMLFLSPKGDDNFRVLEDACKQLSIGLLWNGKPGEHEFCPVDFQEMLDV